MSVPETTERTGPTDEVAEILDRSRADLEARRASGEMPTLPSGSLDRHFEGVVEAVDAGLVDQPPLSASGPVSTAGLPSWRPSGSRLRRRLLGALLMPVTRSVGALVRRQVSPFTTHVAEVLDQVVERQNRIRHFLTRAHLERVASLEARVVELEHELTRLRQRSEASTDGHP